MSDNQTPKEDPNNRQVLSTYKSTLECVLTEAEHKEQAQALAALEDEWQAFIEKKKALTAELNAEKAKIEADRAKTARKVKTGKEHREVSCTITAIFDRNVAVISRDDTGEVISERALQSHERQVAMELPAAEPEKKQHKLKIVDDPAPCEAVVLAGLCTVHGSECPNPETFDKRVAVTKDGSPHPLNNPQTEEAPKTDE